MSSKHRKRDPSKPPRPHQVWRQIRSRARDMGAPAGVLVVLNHLVETQALNPHWRLPRIRLGYGRHSEKERAWDRQRRAQIAAERGRPRLVEMPRQEQPGFAENTGLSRRTVIRAKAWLVGRQLVQIHHELGTHLVPDRFGVEHEIGRGGCLPGGIGCAATWLPYGLPGPPAPVPPPDPGAPPPGPDTTTPAGRMAAEYLARGRPGPRGP